MRSLIDITDFSVEELYDLIKTAVHISENPDLYAEKCRHKKLATLFFEPSTRTRLSFEAAMLELGGSVIGFSEASASSATKGESIADTAKIVSCYADVIAMRSPKEGAALVASMNAKVPVINAGDGGHHHPTQTLADLLTIYREKGRLDNLTVGMCGDLKYGRTVHSLIAALSRYTGIKIVLISPKELELPTFVKREIVEKSGMDYVETTSLEDALPTLDVLYMTRIQRERFDNAKSDMIVLHPLPRVNEISVKVDDDPRACYFKQALNGKYMRMALILKLLEEAKNPVKETYSDQYVEGFKCTNKKCVSMTERELPNLFKKTADGKYRCIYCDKEAD